MFNWVDPTSISFNSYLLMDRWLIKAVLNNENAKFYENMGIALTHHPAVAWYFVTRCPECKGKVIQLISQAPKLHSPEMIRAAEEYVIDATDWAIVYVYPELMNQNCSYIRDWTPERLLSMTDFTDKVVLDVGSGTGRLAFAAATQAKMVYASEPVDRMREYLRDKIQSENIENIVVLDGTIERIPFPDNTFDIVMSGHVMGDNYDRELAELTRVAKPGGYIIDCMGEDSGIRPSPEQKLLSEGFEYFHYVGTQGGDIYRYLMQVKK